MNEVFDRFATAIAAQVARAWFFTVCVLMVLIWAPSYFAIGNLDTWQLIINTLTTIITFLLVALLQNTQDRSTKALQHKLDAVLNALAEILEDTDREANNPCIQELRRMAGIEMESSA